MPTYEYRCPTCEGTHEVVQSMSDPSLTVCPSCGAEGLRKIFANVGVVFKGSGFYRNDSRKDSSSSSSSSESGSGNAGAKGTDSGSSSGGSTAAAPSSTPSTPSTPSTSSASGSSSSAPTPAASTS